MKKSDLKNGMILEFADGDLMVFLKDYECSYFKGKKDIVVDMSGKSSWNDLDSIDENTLKSKLGYVSLDIVKIYKPNHPYCMYQKNYEKTLIWDRDQLKEYTIEELTKIVGHKFKIKK